MESTVSTKMVSLERSVRTLRLVVIALAAFQVSWVMMGAAQQKNDDQKVRRLTIIDKDGKPRITMQTDDAGNPSIRLLDEKGVNWVELYSRDGRAGVAALGAKKEQASLEILPGGASFMLDGAGPYVHMTAYADDQQRYSDIIVADDAVESMARIAAVKQDGGSYFTVTKNGAVSVALHGDQDGTGLTISDDKEAERIRLLLDPAGSSNFQVLDKDGKRITP